jgi:predicted AlkP superfamily pyrophosphatase or phosphodiesterase
MIPILLPVPLKWVTAIFAFFESIVLSFVFLFSTNTFVWTGNYTAKLDKSGIFENTADHSIPQTAMYTIVMNHFTSALPSGKTVKKCAVIGIDGTRADCLLLAKDEAASGILQLKQTGGIYQMYCGGKFPYLQPTVTGCGWASLLTGKWALEPGGHHVTNNGVVKPLEPKTLFTKLIEEGLVKKSLFAVSWNGHFVNDDSTYKVEKEYTEEQGFNVSWVDSNENDGDGPTVQNILNEIADPAGADFLMCTLEACDHAGHSTGQTTTNPNMVKAYYESDQYAADIIAAIKARPNYAKEDWLILATTDHGGEGNGHGAWFSTERQIWIASNKPIPLESCGG